MPNFMPHTRRTLATSAVALALLSGGTLTACGESNKATSNAAATGTVAGSTSSAPATAAGASTTPAPSSTKAAATTRTAPATSALHRAGRAASAPSGRAVNAPFFKRALVAFVACVRGQGIAIPAPNTKGTGPIFDVKGIDTKSPKFRAAIAKCRQVLSAALRTRQRELHGAAGAAPAK